MEDLTITFGGKERRLRLTLADGAALQQQFQFVAASTWLLEDVLGLRLRLGSNTAGDLQAQAATLAVAINRAAGTNSKVMPLQVLEWAGQLMQEISEKRAPEDAWKQILWTLFRTAHRSGWPMQKPFEPDDEVSSKRLFFAERIEDCLEPSSTPETPSTSAPSTPPTVQAAD